MAGFTAAASLALGAVGTATAVAGAENQAKAQSNALQYQAQVAQNNQVIANQLGAQATQAGAVQEQEKRQQTAAVIGSQLAGQSASGLDVNAPGSSAVDVRSSAAELGELDALTIRSNTARTAYGYAAEGLSYQAQAGLDMAGSQNALTAGNLNAFASLAGGASSISDKWLKYQNAGLLTDTSSYSPYTSSDSA